MFGLLTLFSVKIVKNIFFSDLERTQVDSNIGSFDYPFFRKSFKNPVEKKMYFFV